ETLVARDLEVALYRALRPCASDRSVIRADVVELPVDHHVRRLAGRIFGIAFDVDRPIRRVQIRDAHRDCITARIDGPNHFLRVPLHEHYDPVLLPARSRPIAMPGSSKRMAFLGNGKARETTKNGETQNPHHSYYTAASTHGVQVGNLRPIANRPIFKSPFLI